MVVENIWGRMFSDLRITPLSVWHEDVLADPTGVTQRVADYLGVTIDPTFEIEIPEIRKQSEGDARVWIEKYSNSRPA